MRLWLLIIVLHLSWSIPRSDVYPKSIPKFDIRRDEISGEPVSMGHVHTLNRTSLSEFRAHLQCSKKDANMNYNSGTISKMRLVPPTSLDYEHFCALVETHCLLRGGCTQDLARQKTEEDLKGMYTDEKSYNELNDFSNAVLVRVIDNELYIDWPWGMERFEKYFPEGFMLHIFNMTLQKLIDVNDSVFFFGEDDPGFPNDYPVAAFTFSNSDEFGDMIFPWYEMWATETKRYKEVRKKGMSFTENNLKLIEPGYKEWENKVPKAAFFATIWSSRLFLFDQARLHPELFDAGFQDNPACPGAWNPESVEKCDFNDWSSVSLADVNASQSLPAGFLTPILKFRENVHYTPGSYKYVIVPLGNAPGVGLSTSGRLSHVLAYSGAVVLMPRSSYKFHFSAQLVPWVHYVPLSFSGADVAEKVQWLRDHDDLARQIAENGRNFARSYLRLEDYYCYAASALEAMGAVSSMTDVTQTRWNATKAKVIAVFHDSSVFEWPE